jgi:hypothetical protein
MGGGEFDPLAAFLDPGTQKQRPQVLLNRARADVQLPRNFFVAAALDQQLEHLLIAWRNFDFIDVHHLELLEEDRSLSAPAILQQCLRQTFARHDGWTKPLLMSRLRGLGW